MGFDSSLTEQQQVWEQPVRHFQNSNAANIPGVISGGLFAFITSFDEVVVDVCWINKSEDVALADVYWSKRAN